METIRLVLAACFGLVVGSFLNVVIWRLPRGESLAKPGSHCPGCGQGIRWYDNIPVLSWLALRARCRQCKTAIRIRYPLVEATTGALFVLAAWRWPGDLATTAIVSAALAALLAISVIDWDHKIIPDRITKPGIVLAIALAPLTALHPPDWVVANKPALSAWLHAAAGAAVGAGVILAIRIVGGWVFRKEAMGLGDVKLLAFIGAFTGPVQVLYALVLACFGGAFLGILRLLWARGRPLRMELAVEGVGEAVEVDRAWLEEGAIEVLAPRPSEVGQRVRLRMTLPAAGILEEQDADVRAKGKVASSTPASGRASEAAAESRWRIEFKKISEEDADRLAMLSASWRYVPFGPFLALGGAATLLFGDRVHWLITEAYPTWARGILGS